MWAGVPMTYGLGAFGCGCPTKFSSFSSRINVVVGVKLGGAFGCGNLGATPVRVHSRPIRVWMNCEKHHLSHGMMITAIVIVASLHMAMYDNMCKDKFSIMIVSSLQLPTSHKMCAACKGYY